MDRATPGPIDRYLAAVLKRRGRKIPAHTVLAWMESNDPEVRAGVFFLLFDHRRKVAGVEDELIHEFLGRFLRSCLLGKESGAQAPTPLEAAEALRVWFERVWRRRDIDPSALERLLDLLAQVLAEPDDASHRLVATNVITPLLSDPERAAIVRRWSDDPVLRRALQLAPRRGSEGSDRSRS